MNATTAEAHEFLVLSRGQWDEAAPKQDVQDAIERFYVWYEKGLAAGSMKPGHRLAREGRVVSERSVIDGPYAEAKELVGGYWFIVAASLDEAAALAAQNPCLSYGLSLELRPLDPERADAFTPANETPDAWQRGEP